MSLNPGMPAFEILTIAIKSEIEAAKVYSSLYGRVKNEILRMKLKFLTLEEKKHRQILEKLFSQMHPDKEPKIPEHSFLPPLKASLGDEFSVLDLFMYSLKAEKMSEEFYKEAAGKTEEKESKRILNYLTRVERSHYFMIKSEIDMLDKYPDYYNVEDFHLGQDMFHIGP